MRGIILDGIKPLLYKII